MFKKKVLFLAFLVIFAPKVIAQSPNASGAVSRIEVANLQSRSEKGQNNGYAPLGSTGLVPPSNIFPDFSGATAGTIWIKSGSTFAPLNSVSFSSSGMTTNNVFLGAVDTSIYGIKIMAVNSPLILRGGGTINRVMVDYNQSIGGADSGRSAYLWSIGPSGNFLLGGGTFSGNIDFSSGALSGITSAAGSALAVNFTTHTITSSSGSIILAAPTGSGAIVPSTASTVNTTFALNPTSADLLYGRKDTTNTWSQIQTFSAAPVVPDGSFTIAKTSSLQTALDLALKRDGSNSATGTVSLGGFKIVNVGTPTLSGDAVPLSYLTSNYDSTPVNSIAVALSGSSIGVSAANGDVILSVPRASTSVGGYLHQDDWNAFNGKQATLSGTTPVSVIANAVSMTQASASVNGWLSAADYSRFQNPSGITNAKVSSILSSKTSGTDVTTTSPTSVQSYVIPAATLVAGDVVIIRISGNFIVNVTSQTVSLQFKLGGTTALDGTTITTQSPLESAFTGSTSEVPYVMEVMLVVRTTGASGTAYCVSSVSTATQRSISAPAQISIDTTVSRILSIVTTISAITGSPANHFSAEVGTVRIN
jgi:hypothetical protein